MSRQGGTSVIREQRTDLPMATAHVFQVSENIARGYKIPKGRDPLRNGAGVTAIMGLTNGRGAARRAAKKRASIKAKRGGATCWKKPRTKYMRMGAVHRSDYAYPECWAYPIRSHRSKKTSKLLVSAAAKWFRVHGGKYAPRVRSQIARRIDDAARRQGVRSGRLRGSRSAWARSNDGGSPMIVLESSSDVFEENRGRHSRKSRSHCRVHPRGYSAPTRGKKGKRRMYRNGDSDTTSDIDSDVSVFEAVENRRGGRRHSRRRGKGRKSARRVWGSKRRSAGRRTTRRSSARRTRRGSGRRRWGRSVRKGRKSARRTRRGAGRRWGRKSARRTSRRTRRVSARRGHARRGHARRGSRRGYRRNGYEGNPPLSAAQREYLAKARAARGMYGSMPASGPDRAASARAMRAQILRRRAQVAGYRMSPWSSTPFRGFDAPWNRAKNQARIQRKMEKEARKARVMGMAMPAIFQGLGPRDLSRAMKELTKKQVEALFPDYSTFRSWMGAMRGDSKFRRWSSKAGSRRHGRGRGRMAARFGRGRSRRRWGRSSKRFGRGRRWGRGRSRGRGRRSFGRRHGRGRGRRSFGRRWGRGRGRRGYRRNGFMPNMPFTSTGEMIAAGAIGLGTFGALYGLSRVAARVNPLVGAVAGLVLGAGAVWGSDRIFKQTDAYAKAFAVAGIIGMVMSAGKALIAVLAPKATAGFGGPAFANQTARYALNPFGGSPFMQAQAGFGAPFQQALAAPFYQAQAGFGEYVGQGTGEYVSNDGSLAPVSDFGEYVSSGLAVEGYGDYEVMPNYTPGADGFGAINDGVHPGSNMDHQFNIMEAAAGFGSSPSGRSDYVPTVGASNVGSQESSPDAGIFDVGGPNGVFG